MDKRQKGVEMRMRSRFHAGRRRTWALVALIGVLSLIATACSAGAGDTPGSQGTGSAQTTLSVGLGAAPANLDMTQTAGAAIPQALMYNVYEGLVKLDDEGQVNPLLAKSWTISDDRLTYDFVLREGITFSNGAPFTAETVKFNLDRVPEWKANTPSYLAAIDEVSVTSDTELSIKLKQPDNNLLFWLAGPLGAMFDPDAVDKLATEAIGTGPYLLDSYNRNETLILKQNPDYWGEPTKLSEVTLRYYTDANAPVNALRSGQLDVVYQTQAADQVKQFESDDQFKVTTGTTQGIVVMSMNPSREPFDDVRVRQAIMYGVDRDAVNTTATNGYGTVLGAPVPPTDPWYEDLSKEYPYDPAKAKQLLAEAGKSDLTVTFTVPSLSYAQTISQVVKSDLAKIGVTAKLETQEFPAVWLEKTFTQHDYDLTVINHVEPRNIVNYGNPDYYWSFDSPQVRKQLDAAAAAPGETAYTDAMHQVVDTLVHEAPGDWLYNAPNIVVSTASVQGLQTNDTGVSLDLTAVSNPS